MQALDAELRTRWGRPLTRSPSAHGSLDRACHLATRFAARRLSLPASFSVQSGTQGRRDPHRRAKSKTRLICLTIARSMIADGPISR